MSAWIVIPTYNEAQNVERMVAKLLALHLPALSDFSASPRTAAGEPPTRTSGSGSTHPTPLPDPADPSPVKESELSVLIVDDASPDGTGDIVDRLVERLPGRVYVLHRAGKLGLGSAYVHGFRYVLDHGADVVVQMDADFSHSPDYLPKMVGMLCDNDVVVGSRWTPGGKLDDKWERWRYLLSKNANLYARWVTGLRVHDVTAGFKAFRAEALARLPLEQVRSEGYAFQVEMAMASQRLGLRVAELPIYFEERELGRSKMSLRIVLEAMWRVWQIRIRS